MDTNTTHSLEVQAAGNDELTMWQTVSIEPISAEEAEAMDDTFAREAVDDYTADNGEHGIFRVRVVAGDGSVVFTGQPVAVQDPRNDAASIAVDIHSADVFVERVESIDGHGERTSHEIKVGGEVLSFSDARDEDGWPWIGFDYTIGSVEDGARDTHRTGYAGTVDEMRSIIREWLSKQAR